jgi:hypothetical protein
MPPARMIQRSIFKILENPPDTALMMTMTMATMMMMMMMMMTMATMTMMQTMASIL